MAGDRIYTIARPNFFQLFFIHMQLLTNGHIHTPRGEASALLVNDNGIIADVFFGDSYTAPNSAAHIDLQGGWLFPGFEDAHNHPAMMSRALIECDAQQAATWETASQQINEWAAVNPNSEWIVVHGWNQLAWGYLTTADLDRISPTRPIFMIHIAYHGAVLNSAGLRWLAQQHITIEHVDGVLTEEAYQIVETATLPNYKQFLDLLPRYLQRLRGLGITTTHDMWITTVDELRAYRDLDTAGKLPATVEGYINPELLRHPDIAEYLTPGRRFTVRGIKLFLDGSIGSRTAYVHTPYAHSLNYGKLRYSAEQALENIRLMESFGLHSAAIHAIGDAAVSTVLDIYTQAAREFDVRHYRIEHCEMIPESEYGRLQKLGVWPVIQPNFHWDIEHYGDRLGDRIDRINPLHDLVTHNIHFAFGSDNMPTSPLIGVRYATTVGKSHQQLGRVTALEAYISQGACVLGIQNRGILKSGNVADFVLLKYNPFDPLVSLEHLPIIRTWKAGETS